MTRTYKRLVAVILVAGCFRAAYLFSSDLVACIAAPAAGTVIWAIRQSRTVAGSPDITCPAQLTGNGRAGPHLVAARARPAFVLRACDGELVGPDCGKWGGELLVRDASGRFHPLISRNVRYIVRTLYTRSVRQAKDALPVAGPF